MQKIYNVAKSEQIYIAYEDLQRAGDIQGLYTVHPRAGPVIILDQSLLSRHRLHRCVAPQARPSLLPPRTDASTVMAFYRGNYYAITARREIVIMDSRRPAGPQKAADALSGGLVGHRDGYDTCLCWWKGLASEDGSSGSRSGI